jgi:hypothetical protein
MHANLEDCTIMPVDNFGFLIALMVEKCLNKDNEVSALWVDRYYYDSRAELLLELRLCSCASNFTGQQPGSSSRCE